MLFSHAMELTGFTAGSLSGAEDRHLLLDEESLLVAPDYASKRSTVSRRLLSAAQHQGPELSNCEKVVSFAPGCGASGPQPSRRREEALALQNLQRRVEACRLSKAGNIPESVSPSTSHSSQLLDNRPQLLQKILSIRPMTVVSVDAGKELETDWSNSEFIMECLSWHNVYRQRHNSPPLTLCPKLCAHAQEWANHLAHINTFYYRNDRNIGQNMFCRNSNTVENEVTGQEVASYWYSAVRQYNYKEPDVLHANVNAGHFTQLVWSSSCQFGAGKARSRSGKVLVVAHYRPPGNISGQFQQNVRPPQQDSDAEMTSESGSESSTSRSADYGT